MNIRQRLRRGINTVLGRAGFEIRRMVPEHVKNRDMAEMLHAIGRRGHDIGTVVDIGASDGRWTAQAMQELPDSQYLMIEAQPVHADALERFAAQLDNVQIAMAAAGAEVGEVHFDATDPWGGQASLDPLEQHSLVVPMTTIDTLVAERGLPAPYLLKLDTHGFEMPILLGAAATLDRTEVIVIECYNFKIAPESLLFYEMCAYLAGLGFRCIDLADVLYRPYDGALWQMDLVFVRGNRREFDSSRYA